MRRIPELDGLRGIAALAIVALHFFLAPIGRGNWLGHAVDLFFVLSGFLITTILLEVPLDGTSLKAFYARRVLRIWPLYYFGLIATLLLNRAIEPNLRLPISDWPYYATFAQTVPFALRELGNFPSWFHHSWTLAIEEQFYLIWPLLVMGAGKQRIPLLAGGLVLAGFAVRACRFTEFILPTRCDMLALGALLATVIRDGFRGRPMVARGLGLFAATIGVLITIRYVANAVGIYAPFGYRWGGVEISARFSAVGLACMAIVWGAVRASGTRATALLRSRPLAYLGVISYGIYLLHPIVFMAGRLALWNWFRIPEVSMAERVFAAFASVAAAALAWKFLEEPILRLKGRFPYSSRESRVARADLAGWRLDAPVAQRVLDPEGPIAGQGMPDREAVTSSSAR
jgi:peptidoglycan/LPS O-acetylase OafA/YrhL